MDYHDDDEDFPDAFQTTGDFLRLAEGNTDFLLQRKERFYVSWIVFILD